VGRGRQKPRHGPRLLKSNTSKTRIYSLFRQDCMLYEFIPTMPEDRLSPFMTRFAETVSGVSRSRIYSRCIKRGGCRGHWAAMFVHNHKSDRA